jgi:propanol-preferring alcohol dehydrogenase
MSKTMRAYRMIEPGKMPRLVEIPRPEPGPGQVLLRTAGAGLCHSDLGVIHADPPFFEYPMTLGHEATGWVEAVGAGVSGVSEGDGFGVYFSWGCGRCDPCAHGAENVCNHAASVGGLACGRDGGMADYILVDSPRHLIPLGKLDAVAAAPLMCAGLTAYHGISDSMGLLEPGSAAVIIGIGGLGHLAIQILKAITPARIIAIDTQPEKLDQAISLGAHDAFLAGPQAAEEVRAATGGLGARLVLDLVGNDATLAFAASVLSFRGNLKVIGVGGGTLPIRFPEMPRDCSVSIPYAGTISDQREVVRLAEAGLITPHVTTIGYEAMEESYRIMKEGKLQGRFVLTPSAA